MHTDDSAKGVENTVTPIGMRIAKITDQYDRGLLTDEDFKSCMREVRDWADEEGVKEIANVALIDFLVDNLFGD